MIAQAQKPLSSATVRFKRSPVAISSAVTKRAPCCEGFGEIPP